MSSSAADVKTEEHTKDKFEEILFCDEKIDDLISCQICYQNFNSEDQYPLLLPCGHSFCVKCIKKMLEPVEYMQSEDEYDYQEIKCPIDKSLFDLVDERELVKNYELLKEIEV